MRKGYTRRPGTDLLDDKPYSEEHGSVEIFLVNREIYDHPLRQQDNHKLYKLLVKSWSRTGINYCSTGNEKRFKEDDKLFQQSCKEFAVFVTRRCAAALEGPASRNVQGNHDSGCRTQKR